MNYIFSYNVVYNDQFESINYIEAFCESLRRINYKDKLILFTESIDRIKPLTYGLNTELVLVQDIYKRFVVDPNYPLVPGLDDLNIQRLYIYQRYIIENNIKHTDNILFVDSRDVIFQNNPFDHINDSKLTFGEESIPYVNDWTIPQFEIYRFDENIYSSIMSYRGSSINSNCIGSIKNFLRFVDDFNEEIKNIKKYNPSIKTKIPISDQIIINKLLAINKLEYCEVLPYINNIIVSNLVDGHFTYDGKTVCIDDKPISIVHQYDRNPTVFRLLLAQYSI